MPFFGHGLCGRRAGGFESHALGTKKKGPIAGSLFNQVVGDEGCPRAAGAARAPLRARRPSRAPLENGAAVSSAPRPLGFESPQCAQNHNGPVAGTDIALVGAVGLEPTIPKAEDFKSPAYANSATPPCRESVPRCAAHGHVLGFPSRTNNDAVNRPAHRFGKITPYQGTS